jgi:ribonuclease P protein component
MESLRPPGIWRIDRRDIFEALRGGRRQRLGPLTVTWVPGDPAEPPRVAFSIGRRVGDAVVRNRLRRRLRMLMRQAAPRMKSGAYLVGVAPEAGALSFHELEDLVTQIMKSLDRT